MAREDTFASVVFRQGLAAMSSSTAVTNLPVKKEPTKKTSQNSDSSFPLNADALAKQKNMLRTMSTHGLQAKWRYLKNCSPFKNQARTLARKIEKELIRRKVLVEDDDESTLTEGSWCD